MPQELLTELGERTRAHPWWQARASLTAALLKRLQVLPPARVLDAGCGWGVTLDALEARGYRVDGLDISRPALERLDRPDRRLIEADLQADLPEVEPLYDAVLALDVIEHLDDDRAAVRRLLALVRPGGWLVVSVPALPELFAEFDAVQGHRRRYLPETLRAAFEDMPATSLQTFWWGAWMVPLVRFQRRGRGTVHASGPGMAGPAASLRIYRRYLRLPPRPGPLLMRLAFSFEKRFALSRRLSTGTSLFAIARRSGTLPPAV
jgi:SAM-dependent methyltransferase